MKSFDIFFNRPITAIFRIDEDKIQDEDEDKEDDNDDIEDENYYPIYPIGIFLMFDKENGFLINSQNDGMSINLEAATFYEACNYQGFGCNRTLISEVKQDEELSQFIGESIKSIKVGVYNESELSGKNFIIKQGKYAGITITCEENKFTFYNNLGGWIWYDEIEFPKKARWTLFQYGY